MPRKRKRKPSMSYNSTCSTYLAEAIGAAKELGYGKKTVKALENAQSENEIAHIMHEARKRKFGLED